MQFAFSLPLLSNHGFHREAPELTRGNRNLMAPFLSRAAKPAAASRKKGGAAAADRPRQQQLVPRFRLLIVIAEVFIS